MSEVSNGVPSLLIPWGDTFLLFSVCFDERCGSHIVWERGSAWTPCGLTPRHTWQLDIWVWSTNTALLL